MKVTVESVDSVTRKIMVSIPQTKVKKELDRAYRNLQRDVRMHGFRPGKVPRMVLEARFRTQIEGEVRTKLISDSLESTIEEQKFFVVSQPSIEPGRLASSENFDYTATVEIKPEVDAKNFLGLEVQREKFIFDETMVEKELKTVQQQKAELIEVQEERALAVDDIARIEYVMKVDDSDPLEAQSVHLHIGDDSFIPGFAEKIVGMNKGEIRVVGLDLPVDHEQKALAGRHVELTVTLHDIKKRVTPELDDEFAKDLEFDDLDALRASIRENIEKQLRDSSDAKIRREVAEMLIARNEIHLPLGLVNQQVELLAEEQRRSMGRQAPQGKLNLTDEQRTELVNEAEFRIRSSLILESIAQQENLEVTSEHVDRRLEEIARESHQRVEAVKGYYMKNNAMDDLKAKVLEEMALEHVIGKAVVIEVELPFDDDAHDHTH